MEHVDTREQNEDEPWPLSGEPYFSVIIGKANIKPYYRLYPPAKLYPVFPSARVPVVFVYCGKCWKLAYIGDDTRKRFDGRWKDFVIDNGLKVGDVCVFELTESSNSNLKFKVQILRGDFPSELLANTYNASTSTPTDVVANAQAKVDVETVGRVKVEAKRTKRIKDALIEQVKVEAKRPKTIKTPLIEQPQDKPAVIPESEEEEDVEFWPMSGKPHFEVVLTKSNLNLMYHLLMPAKIHIELPSVTVPVVVECRGKKWQMVYIGDHIPRRIQRGGWKVFAVDNDLRIGDACVFELVESNNDSIRFKAQILRGDFPSELLERKEGSTKENPINIQ